jgi:hypothetical protein
MNQKFNNQVVKTECENQLLLYMWKSPHLRTGESGKLRILIPWLALTNVTYIYIYIIEYQSSSPNMMYELELVGSHHFCENCPTLLKTKPPISVLIHKEWIWNWV